MYSHQDNEKFATGITLIATIPFVTLFILAMIGIIESL